jgi:type I restriction enzyme S subunit
MVSEWRECCLGELAEIYDGPHATPSKTEKGPIFLGISNLNGGRLDLSNTEHLSEDDYQKWTRRVTPQTNDIVFSYETRLGEAALIPSGLKCCLGRRMGLLRPIRELVDSRFLLYAYLGQDFQETLRAHTIHGSTVDRIPLMDMPKFPISVPCDIHEQRTIAHILGTLDDKIELNRRMNETLEAMARAIFKSWFVDFDPVRAKAEGRDTGLPEEIADLFPDSFEETELGEVPKGWEVCGLDEIATFLNGLALQKYPPNEGDELPVIKIAQLHKGDTIGSDRCSTNIPQDYIVKNGEVLFSWSGSLECELWTGGRGGLNQHLFKVSSDKFPKWFYYYWIHQHLPSFRHIAAGKATTMGHIQRHHLSDSKVIIPDAKYLVCLTK